MWMDISTSSLAYSSGTKLPYLLHKNKSTLKISNWQASATISLNCGHGMSSNNGKICAEIFSLPYITWNISCMTKDAYTTTD
jgi:hypothetical protein